HCGGGNDAMPVSPAGRIHNKRDNARTLMAQLVKFRNRQQQPAPLPEHRPGLSAFLGGGEVPSAALALSPGTPPFRRDQVSLASGAAQGVRRLFARHGASSPRATRASPIGYGKTRLPSRTVRNRTRLAQGTTG